MRFYLETWKNSDYFTNGINLNHWLFSYFFFHYGVLIGCVECGFKFGLHFQKHLVMDSRNGHNESPFVEINKEIDVKFWIFPIKCIESKTAKLTLLPSILLLVPVILKNTTGRGVNVKSCHDRSCSLRLSTAISQSFWFTEVSI